MENALASSRKAWRAIQALTGRAIYGSQYQTIGDADRIKIPTAAQSDHPWRATRNGNTIRFTPGIVSRRSTFAPYEQIVDDAGGYEYIPTSEGGAPVYLYIYIESGADTPSLISTDDGISTGSYVVMPVGSFVNGAYGDVTYSPPPGKPFRYYYASSTIAHEPTLLSFIPPDGSPGNAFIPFLYITDDSMVQLLDKNISLNSLAAHRNLNLWP
jgi:hypothetical protein